jgi:adenylate cyclase
LSLFNELKRRNVFRVGIAYLMGAWLLAQIAELLLDTFNSPDWTMQFFVVVLIIGFPLALFFAWAFELTPEGLKREHEVDRSQSITQQTSRKLDFMIIGVLLVALGYFAYDKLVLTAERDAALVEATKQAVSEQGDLADSEKSIAVLPFVNMSEDAGNEYFADGLSEELLNMLVKIPELRVAARTSSFSFKGKDLQISEIAHQLNVSHVLEGSVRKSGNKVRITAQLIKADDGYHLWSENFDRTLDDIFVVQDEIASEVSKALQVTLLGHSRSENEVEPEAYALWLKGLYFLNQRGKENSEKSVQVLLKAIEIKPDYAAAWQLLSMVYYTQTSQNFRIREDGYALAMDAIDRAMSLDPDLAETWGAYGILKKNLDWDWDSAQTALARAHQLDPNSNIIRIWRASLIQTLGRFDEAIELYQEALAVDPLNLSAHSSIGIMYRKTGRFDDAIAIFNKQVELRPQYHWAYFNLGKTYLFKGDEAQALVAVEKNPSNLFRELGLVLAYSTLGREAEAQTVLQRLVAREGGQNPTWIAEAFAWRGEKDQAFKWLEEAYDQKDIGLAYMLGNYVFESLRDDPRWAELLEKLHLLVHWQAMPPAYGGPTITPD